MQVQANLVSKLKFTAHNDEDDWEISCYAETIEQLIDIVANKIVESNICIDSWWLERVDVLLYSETIFEVGNNEDLKTYPYFLEKVYASSTYISLKEKSDRKKQRKKENRMKIEKQQQEEREKKEYLRLKQKYEEQSS